MPLFLEDHSDLLHCEREPSELSVQAWNLDRTAMTEFSSGRSKQWTNTYSSANPTPSQTPDREATWKSFGTSLNAISFGFVATAILISMFLIMAIFEHLIRPRPSLSSSQDATDGSMNLGAMRVRMHMLGKLGNPPTVSTSSYASDFSVLMPGEYCPTFIAQPAPLPCRREEIYWPTHAHDFVSP